MLIYAVILQVFERYQAIAGEEKYQKVVIEVQKLLTLYLKELQNMIAQVRQYLHHESENKKMDENHLVQEGAYFAL